VTRVWCDRPQGSSFSILIELPGFDSRQGLGIFLFVTGSRATPKPTQFPIKRLPGVKWPLHLVKRLRMRAAIHVFITWCLVKHRDNFIFTFYFTGF